MSEYIKREDAVNKLADECVFDARSEYEGTFTRADFIDDAKETLADIPNADVVEVVRCKHCMYNDRGWCGAQEYGTRHVEDNDFCSQGEKKEMKTVCDYRQPEIHINNNTCGIPVGDYIITQATGNYGMGSDDIYYDISMRPIKVTKDDWQFDPIRRRIKEDIERMYGNYDGSYVNMYDPFGTKVFSSSMQKRDMSAFDIENIFVNEEKGTIVVKWGDGATTKVKLEKGDVFDLEAGVSFALLKRLLISHHHLQRVIKDKVVYSGKEKPNVRRTKSRGSDK